MKKIKHQLLGYTQVYNPQTCEVENKECLALVLIPWTEANEEIAKQVAYNGEYEIVDTESGDPDAPGEKE